MKIRISQNNIQNQNNKVIKYSKFIENCANQIFF